MPTKDFRGWFSVQIEDVSNELGVTIRSSNTYKWPNGSTSPAEDIIKTGFEFSYSTNVRGLNAKIIVIQRELFYPFDGFILIIDLSHLFFPLANITLRVREDTKWIVKPIYKSYIEQDKFYFGIFRPNYETIGVILPVLVLLVLPSLIHAISKGKGTEIIVTLLFVPIIEFIRNESPAHLYLRGLFLVALLSNVGFLLAIAITKSEKVYNRQIPALFVRWVDWVPLLVFSAVFSLGGLDFFGGYWNFLPSYRIFNFLSLGILFLFGPILAHVLKELE